MRKFGSTTFTGKDLFLAVTMIAIIATVLIVGGRSTYLRSKAYDRSANGVRIEAEEMNATGSVVKDATGSFVTF